MKLLVVGIENTRRMKLDPEKVERQWRRGSHRSSTGRQRRADPGDPDPYPRQKKARYGAAGICNGGGGASAMVIENLL